jgi:hypothetical protein
MLVLSATGEPVALVNRVVFDMVDSLFWTEWANEGARPRAAPPADRVFDVGT